MDDAYQNSPRQVLPRWRSLARTPGEELVATRGKASPVPLSESINRLGVVERKAWLAKRNVAEASELLEAAAVSGLPAIAEDAAYWIMRNAERARPSQVRLAKILLGIAAPIEDAVPNELFANPDKLYAKARALKSRLVDHPRDAITRAELARLYLILGQPRKAQASMHAAVKIAPDNRFVLRSAAQLFATTQEAQHGLDLLWRSDAVKSDPWVQAAEVALADSVDRGPRYGSKRLASLVASKQVSTSYSELSAGLASLEWKSGVKRSKVKKLLEKSITSPTENALAQAVWLSNESDIEVGIDSMIALNVSAFEARSRSEYELGNYEACSKDTLKWLHDQPFSREAARDFVFVNSVHLANYSESADVGKAALRLHPNDFTLVNGNVYALVMAKRIDEARVARSNLQKLKHGPDAIPFLHAADGLLAFAEGNISYGRESYLHALETARDLKKPHLVLNAYIYWLEQEAHAGTLSPDEMRSNIDDLELAMQGLSANIVSEAKPTWISKKQQIISETYKKEDKVTRQINISGGRTVSYTIESRHLTAAMRST